MTVQNLPLSLPHCMELRTAHGHPPSLTCQRGGIQGVSWCFHARDVCRCIQCMARGEVIRGMPPRGTVVLEMNIAGG